jgi:LysR family transcriptional regulator, low CO2-responsive transcriptional regulator
MRPTLETRQLCAYVTTARTLNMARTAEELGLTPSGVSRCLKTLEDELGCRLFERSTRRMAPTAAGREFLPQAKEILDRLQTAQERLRAWGDLRRGQLRLGAVETVGQFVLPPALREFRESFPGFTVKIEVCPAGQAAGLLAAGQIDLAMLPEPSSHAGTEFQLLAEDDLQFVVHPLHPWAIARRVPRDSIAAARLVLPGAGHATRELVTDYFRREGIELKPYVEIENEDAIKHFVRLDLGVAVLPRWLVADEVEQGMVVTLPLGRRRLRRRWGVLHQAARQLGFAESLLVSLCRNVLRELMTRRA